MPIAMSGCGLRLWLLLGTFVHRVIANMNYFSPLFHRPSFHSDLKVIDVALQCQEHMTGMTHHLFLSILRIILEWVRAAVNRGKGKQTYPELLAQVFKNVYVFTGL